MMTNLCIAKEFFQRYLPKQILDEIDLDTLILMDAHFINQSLKMAKSDLIYRVDLRGNRGSLYLVCEHQSTVDTTMSYRFLTYDGGIWANEIKKEKVNFI